MAPINISKKISATWVLLWGIYAWIPTSRPSLSASTALRARLWKAGLAGAKGLATHLTSLRPSFSSDSWWVGHSGAGRDGCSVILSHMGGRHQHVAGRHVSSSWCPLTLFTGPHWIIHHLATVADWSDHCCSPTLSHVMQHNLV